MKKIFYVWFFGLMSLLTMSSCEDKFTYDAEKNFMPIEYAAKLPVGDEGVATTLLVKGVKELVFDEIEKSDWRIITQANISFRGKEPLNVISTSFAIEEDDPQLMHVASNYGDIPVTFGNTMVTYNYMGQEVVLQPENGMHFSVVKEEKERFEEPFFYQKGKLVFRLMVGYVVVKVHEVDFSIIDEDSDVNSYNPGDQGNSDSSDENSPDGQNTDDSEIGDK